MNSFANLQRQCDSALHKKSPCLNTDQSDKQEQTTTEAVEYIISSPFRFVNKHNRKEERNVIEPNTPSREELCKMLDSLSDKKLDLFLQFLKGFNESNGKGERE